MKKLKYIAPILIAVACLGLQQAKADTTYTLSSPNTAVSAYPAPYGTVTVHLTDSTHATVTFNAASSGGYSYLFIDGGAAAVNVRATSWTITTIASVTPATGGFVAQPAGWPQSGGSGNEDGFGVFNQTVNGFDGTDHAMSQISFTLTNTSGTWNNSNVVLIANSQFAFAAAHIVVFNSNNVTNGAQLATGFVATGGGIVPDGGTTVMLLGVALGALGMVRRYLVS
jgi:VPDSG-CTERM motif